MIIPKNNYPPIQLLWDYVQAHMDRLALNTHIFLSPLYTMSYPLLPTKLIRMRQRLYDCVWFFVIYTKGFEPHTKLERWYNSASQPFLCVLLSHSENETDFHNGWKWHARVVNSLAVNFWHLLSKPLGTSYAHTPWKYKLWMFIKAPGFVYLIDGPKGSPVQTPPFRV